MSRRHRCSSSAGRPAGATRSPRASPTPSSRKATRWPRAGRAPVRRQSSSGVAVSCARAALLPDRHLVRYPDRVSPWPGWAPSLGKLATFGLALALGACATASAPSRPPSAPSQRPTIEAVVGASESGEASWYGPDHQGRPTASGEPVDAHKLTAAHRTLPLGTNLLVTNLRNGRTVRVRVNDRGPVVPGRIIDLSYAAADVLGYLGAGLAPVRIQVLSLPR